jgi:hypothetical protein
MKIICECGAKYAIDATPDMARHPVTFACPTCGVDLSAQLNAMARQELGAAIPAPAHSGFAPATEIAPPPPGVVVSPSAPPPPQMRIALAGSPHSEAAPPPAPAPVGPPIPPPVRVSTGAPQVRLSQGATSAAAAATSDVKDVRFCSKHPQQRVTEKCRVCAKPICPSCMQLFGYVCSPHCKEKAELQGIVLPKFAMQRDEVQRKEWRKIGLVVKLAALFILTILGVWFWYAWFGSRPRPAFAVRFEDAPAMSGSSSVCDGDQIVFVHGAKLARYDLKTKKQVWLRQLIDRKKIEEMAAASIKEMHEESAKSEFPFKVPPLEKFTKEMIRSAEESLELRVQGHNIWIADGKKVRRFDWDTGELKQEVEFDGSFADGTLRGDELEFKEQVDVARLSVTRFNLASGKVQTDEIGEKPKPEPANMAALLAATGGKSKTPGNVRGMSPQQLAAAVANAPLAGRLAAPATISVARNQQAALDVMDEMDGELDGALAAHTGGGLPASLDADDKYLFRENSTLIPAGDSFIQMTSQMTEKNIISRSAAKAPPKKSALDGPVNAAATMDIANELLNEMSRNAGGDIVREDHSKYKVKIHLGGAAASATDWEGEVVGEPEIYPQVTVNVLADGKKIIVFDKQNKVKWESALNYPLSGGGSYFELDQAEQRGQGPVVERGDALYVYDQGVLSAFELASGQARWRLPSVGIAGMFFDDDGMIYLNTTTASPDKIKYSRQIDVNDSTGDIVLKLDPKNGKEIWKHSMGGKIAYLSGKYIYTLSYSMPRDDDDEFDENLAVLGLESKPYIRIRRISPRNGRVLWDHHEPRGALDVKIHNNTFQVVMKKEVQVLKFISF